MALPPPNPALNCDVCSTLSRIRVPRTDARLAAEAKMWATLNEYTNRMREVVTDEQIAEVRATIARARSDWAAASTRTIGNAERWDADRLRHRESLQKAILNIVPEYRQLRELQTAGGKAVAQHAGVQFPPFEPVVFPADPVPVVHHPPFSQSRLGPLDLVAVNTMNIADRSFVLRDIGHIILDADLTANPGGIWGFNEWFGIIPPDNGSVSAACGTAFTVPADGRLQVTATLRNLYSRTNLSITDEWGSSWGSLSVSATFFVAMLRPDGGEVLHSTLSGRRLESDGDNKSDILPDIEQRDFRLLGNTEGRFEAGESVSVLAGVAVGAGSILNDMKIHVRTLMWWVLEELGVAVVQ